MRYNTNVVLHIPILLYIPFLLMVGRMGIFLDGLMSMNIFLFSALYLSIEWVNLSEKRWVSFAKRYRYSAQYSRDGVGLPVL